MKLALSLFVSLFTVVSAAADNLPGTGRIPAGTLYGVTLDDVTNVDGIVDSLGRLSKKATTRVVFDRRTDPGDYAEAVSRISKVSYVMGEILDSYELSRLSPGEYEARTQAFFSALKPFVDIWEVGNEVSGDWVGSEADVVAKIAGAYDFVKGQGGVTALTLYYCYEDPSREMVAWSAKHLPDRMKQGLDYLFVSYYEDDCALPAPDWNATFTALATLFPHSRLGFGENGTLKTNAKARLIRKYYSMTVAAQHYVGGHFWWYGYQDFVPYTNGLWSLFDKLIATH